MSEGLTAAPAPAAAIARAGAAAEVAEVKALFLEYAESLDFELCFQGFDEEMARFPGDYAAPAGALLLASVEGAAAGAVGLRPLGEGVCEMKRLYVRPAYRSQGLGRALIEASLDQGRRLGYGAMRLDTLPSMAAAIALYEAYGFKDIGAYTHNPLAGVRYLERALA